MVITTAMSCISWHGTLSCYSSKPMIMPFSVVTCPPSTLNRNFIHATSLPQAQDEWLAYGDMHLTQAENVLFNFSCIAFQPGPVDLVQLGDKRVRPNAATSLNVYLKVLSSRPRAHRMYMCPSKKPSICVTICNHDTWKVSNQRPPQSIKLRNLLLLYFSFSHAFCLTTRDSLYDRLGARKRPLWPLRAPAIWCELAV
ncbi:hypothetical protein BDV97DRAFT_187000 [Delphinella strobiligena]|nr:hypothetical protein BDV97DRAFT_187000 [Delphinella strobiligena]